MKIPKIDSVTNILLPCKVFEGTIIYVIESENRTGSKTEVWKNKITSFTHSCILYRFDNSHPTYRELFENFNKTWFLDEKLAKKTLKLQLKEKKESVK